MNSIMGPIFNESFAEKKRFVGPVNSVWDPLEKALLPQKRTSKKKKKRKKKRFVGPIDVHEICKIKYSHIYIFSLTFMLFCN